MIQYVKTTLWAKSNGLFEGFGILIKQTTESDARFMFVYKDGTFAMGGEDASSFVFDRNSAHPLTINTDSGCLRCADVFVGSAFDSFETLLISERLRTDSVFSNHRVVLGDEVLQPNGVFSVTFDDLFIRERNEATATSGVLIKSAYTSNEIYSGFSSYHHNQRVHRFNTPTSNDKPYRIGIELEVYARDRAAYEKITTARTNWFQCESDSSLNERAFPIELKTIPLRPVDATSVDFWSEPMSKLAALAVSKGYSSTGLHVHISKEILGATEAVRQKNLNKLITFYTYYVEDDPAAKEKNKIICGRGQGYHVNPDGAKSELGNFAKMIGFSEVNKNDEAFQIMSEQIKNTCAEQRGDINIGNWDTYGTIEFRKGDGRISRTRLAAICTWWEQMCLYCKETHPRDFSFETFFNRVCRDYPAVAYFFQQDEEC